MKQTKQKLTKKEIKCNKCNKPIIIGELCKSVNGQNEHAKCVKLTKKEIKRIIKYAKSEIKHWALFIKRASKLLIIIAIFSLGFIPSKPIIYKAEAKEPEYRLVEAEVTAYNPHKSQTDNTPDINAMGIKVQEGDIACPRSIEFETRVEIDNKVYVCRDRMAKRYTNNFDILMFSHKEALEYGRQNKVVKIINL